MSMMCAQVQIIFLCSCDQVADTFFIVV